MNTGVHVVLGAGQVGSLLAQQLRARGLEVRVVRRSGEASDGARIGDVANLEFAEGALRGAEVVYHCVNVSYERWAEVLPRVTTGVLHGATRAGARLVVLDNLYMLDPAHGPLRPESAIEPRSGKSALRAALAERFLEADRAGNVRVAIGRASDFFGPGVTMTAVFGERFFKRMAAGQRVEFYGDCELAHSYSYAPDVAAGLATLGTNEAAMGQVWHLPVAPAESTRQMIARFDPALRLARLSPLMLRAVGLFSPLVRELVELDYQWRSPWVVDDSKFRAAFGLTHTTLETSVRATAEWARSRYR